MKYDIKLLSLTILLGSLYYFISHSDILKLTQNKPNESIQNNIKYIDNNLPKITTAKPLYSVREPNFLGLGGNYKSKN
jgi:hypothetical protein